MPERVAAERVATEQDDVQHEHEAPDADPEGGRARRRVLEPEPLPGVVGEEDEEREGEDEEVAVDVLEHEGEAALAPVAAPGLADGARGRIRPERLVVRAPVVVAGEAESDGRPEDQEGGREGEPAGPARRPRTEERVRGVAEDLGGIEGREIGTRDVELSLEGGPRAVDDEGREAEEDGQRLRPPRIRARRPAEAPGGGKRGDRIRHGEASCLSVRAAPSGGRGREGAGAPPHAPRRAGPKNTGEAQRGPEPAVRGAGADSCRLARPPAFWDLAFLGAGRRGPDRV